uniref:Lipoprotein n=1 Tax=Chryseobacterium endophyticum TaxID=1854762 RepID=A0AAU6WUV4_9FLAO
MSRILIPLFFLLLFSCKKAEYHDGKNRYATVATINSKDSLLAYSYTKGSNYEIKLEDLRTYKTIYSKKSVIIVLRNPGLKMANCIFPNPITYLPVLIIKQAKFPGSFQPQDE